MNPTTKALWAKLEAAGACVVTAGLLAWFFILIFTGCASPTGQLATQSAMTAGACLLIDRKPAAAPWLEAVAGAWISFTETNLPTPGDMEATLAALPNADLSQAEQRALWAGTVAAYAAVWQSESTNEPGRAALRQSLNAIGWSLRAAVDTCRPKTQARALGATKPACDAQGVFDIAHFCRSRISKP